MYDFEEKVQEKACGHFQTPPAPGLLSGVEAYTSIP